MKRKDIKTSALSALAFLLYTLILLMAFSCKTKKKFTDTSYSYQETYDSAWRPVEFKVESKKVSVDGTRLFDRSAIYLQGQDKTFTEYRHYNNDSTAFLSAQVDSLGNYILNCQSEEQILRDSVLTLNKTIKETTREFKEEVKVKSKWHLGLGFGIGVAVILVFLIIRLIKRYVIGI